jgi:thiamine-phosphate diphosphorylase
VSDPSAERRRRTRLLRGIYALVDPRRRPVVPFVEALLAGGIRVFQLRAKSGLADDMLVDVVARVRAADGITIVNDDVAAATRADGLHLGQEDAAGLDLDALRRRMPDAVIGLSCGTPSEARAVDNSVVDYLGIGPLFATPSKPDAGLPIGVSGVRAVVEATPLPAAVIGGIDRARIGRARETGASMAAIISALADADDVEATARAFVDAWHA